MATVLFTGSQKLFAIDGAESCEMWQNPDKLWFECLRTTEWNDRSSREKSVPQA